MSERPDAPLRIRAEVAFGKPLRNGLELVRSMGKGTMVVLGCDGCHEQLIGRNDASDEPVTAGAIQRAAYNDGATVLSSDLERIVRKHAILNPEQVNDVAPDGGTRHLTAARFSRQTEHPVIAVSEEKEVITLFLGRDQFILAPKADLRTKAADLIDTLDTILNLSTTGRNTAWPAQKITSATDALEGHLAELGTDGAELRSRYDVLTHAARQQSTKGTTARNHGTETGASFANRNPTSPQKRGKIRVELLGEVFVDDQPITAETAQVIVAMALSRDGRTTAHAISTITGGAPGGVATQLVLNQIRDLGLGITRVKSEYVLDLEQVELDTDEFLTGVRDLHDPPRAAEVDQLTALWRGDPQALYPGTRNYWYDLMTARTRLLDLVKAMPRRDQRALQGLDAFISHFPDRMPPWVFGVAALNGRRPGRRRLLIVEDIMADDFIEQLGRHYDCIPLRSLPEWRDLVTEGDLDFDAALVDLHLTEAGDDAQGVEVLEHLRDRHGPPATLISTKPQPGDVDALKRKYGLSGLYLKGPGDSMPGLLSTIERSIKDGRPAPG